MVEWRHLPPPSDFGGFPDARISVASRFAMTFWPLAVCSNDEWLNQNELVRIQNHARTVWAPLAERGTEAVWCVYEGTQRPVCSEASLQTWIASGRMDVVLLEFATPRCPPGHLAYALGPRGARVLSR